MHLSPFTWHALLALRSHCVIIVSVYLSIDVIVFIVAAIEFGFCFFFFRFGLDGISNSFLAMTPTIRNILSGAFVFVFFFFLFPVNNIIVISHCLDVNPLILVCLFRRARQNTFGQNNRSTFSFTSQAIHFDKSKVISKS